MKKHIIHSSILSFVLVTLLAFGQQAFAVSGDLINNIAAINYQVGGATQTVINSSPTGNNTPGVAGTNTVVVEDQLVNFAVVRSDINEVVVTPGTTSVTRAAFTIYNVGSGNTSTINANGAVISGSSLTNYSNGTITVSNFLASNASGNPVTPQNSLPDTFDTSSCQIFSAASGGSVITSLIIGPNSAKSVYVSCTIPTLGTDTQQLESDDAASIFFKAQVTEGWNNTTGTSVPATNASNTIAGLEFVYLDPIGDDADGVINNGIHSDLSGFVIKTVKLTATKTATVVSDPINGTTNPYAIPGAVILYTITVANSSTTTVANGVTISDTLSTSFNAPNVNSVTITNPTVGASPTKSAVGQVVTGNCDTIGTGTVALPATCTLTIRVSVKSVP